MIVSLVLSTLCNTLFAASLTLAPRVDLVQGTEETLIARGLLKSSLTAEKGSFKLYLDGFGEGDTASKEMIEFRRSPAKGYLQEAYIEFKQDIFFLKLGKQSARWSESWIVPSLDVWTSRRYNRLFVDPLPEQLVHSSGVVGSVVKSNWQMDLAVMFEKSEDVFPEPLPEKMEVLEKELVHPGVRFKVQHAGFDFGLIAARALSKNTIGVQGNYAFDQWVPKFEAGMITNEQKDSLIESKNLTFATIGTDIFLGDWVIAPQLTNYKGDNPYDPNPETEYLAYLSITWTTDKHELQAQGYTNTVVADAFGGILYSYHLWQKATLGFYGQTYQGDGLNFTSLTQDRVGDTIYGVRFQWNEVFEY